MSRALKFLAGFAVTATMTVLAAIVGLVLWRSYIEAPWTRDGRVRADVVALAPDVSGLVTEVLVEDNEVVTRGTVLFRIDPERFSIALRQAEAVVESRNAAFEQAASDAARYGKLSDASVSQQKLELVRATAQQAKATYDQAVADRDLAKLNLDRSAVRASVNGRITNMDLRPGSYVTVGRGTVALIDTDTLRVEGYFEETKLHHIHDGDPATVQLMGRDAAIEGHVESIAGGIEDRERATGGNLMANINPTFSWVRLAQRVPVRIAIQDARVRAKLLVGLTATVTVHPPGDDAWKPLPDIKRILTQLSLIGCKHPTWAVDAPLWIRRKCQTTSTTG